LRQRAKRVPKVGKEVGDHLIRVRWTAFIDRVGSILMPTIRSRSTISLST
jgi:hypothetical protein